MKKLIIAAGLLLSSCATVQPAAKIVCEGCQALAASGACNLLPPTAKRGEFSLAPTCQPGTELVITNWDDFISKQEPFKFACKTIK